MENYVKNVCFNGNDFVRMKGPARKENDAKPSKTKRINSLKLHTTPSVIPTTYDEAKANCKARKRKERQESISSLCQEKKVIRSNSEERPIQKKLQETKNNCIRRVNSNEEVRGNSSGSVNNENFCYEDYEHEKRRSHERFARPLTLKSRKSAGKRLKNRYLSRTKFKPELPSDDKNHHHHKLSFLKLHVEEKEHQPKADPPRSPSPIKTPISPVFDFSTLHEQIDCNEPVLSQYSRQISENTETMPSLSVASNRLLSSPRNSIIATHRIYLDPDVPKMNSSLNKNPENPVDERLQKISKQINSLKKKIKKYEAEFENKNGYKPSHIEKISDKNAKKWYADLNKLKKDQKQLSEISGNCSLLNGNENSNGGGDKISLASLQITINEIEKKLTAKREAAHRSFNLEEMTSEQLMDEKVAIQKALLYLESIHGRPNHKEDRDIVRPFYDRYRTLKRMVSKISTISSIGNELATIHENETMHFVTPTSSSQSNDTESEKNTLMPSISTDSDTDTSIGENLHSLPKEELLEQLKAVMEERKELKRRIKEFELEVQVKTGKMIQKDEKAPMETIYASYKKVKAKHRLLEALVGKQTQ